MATRVETLARLLNGEIIGEEQLLIEQAQPIHIAGPQDITFVANEANLRKLADSDAGAVIVSRSLAERLVDEDLPLAVILVEDAQTAIVEALEHLRPRRPRAGIGLSPKAHISLSAKIGENTNIFPSATIGDDVVIGTNCDIHPGVCIGPGCRLGDDVTLFPNVVLYADVVLGSRVRIHASSVIGADGFGYRLIDDVRQKIPHFGIVRIYDDVEIGACSTVDRAMFGETVIGEGTKIDNLVIVAHNCEIGRHNALVSQVGLAGSVTTGDYVICAGQVGVSDHVHLGAGCVIGSKAGVTKDVPPGESYLGVPAQPAAETMKAVMSQKKLPEMRKTLRHLENKVLELTTKIDALPKQQSSSPRSAA